MPPANTQVKYTVYLYEYAIYTQCKKKRTHFILVLTYKKVTICEKMSLLKSEDLSGIIHVEKARCIVDFFYR